MINLLETDDYKWYRNDINKTIQEKYNLTTEEIFCIQKFWVGLNNGVAVSHEDINDKKVLNIELMNQISCPKEIIINHIINGIKKFPKYQLPNTLYRIIKHKGFIENHNGRVLISFTDNVKYIESRKDTICSGYDDLGSEFGHILVLKHHNNLGYDLREISNCTTVLGDMNKIFISEAEIVFIGDEVDFCVISERILEDNIIEQSVLIKSSKKI